MKHIAYLCVFAVLFPAIVFGATSANYQLNQEGTGFTEYDGSSTNYNFKAVIGDAASEVSVSTNYTMYQRRTWATAVTTDDGDDDEPSVASSGGGGGGSLVQTGATFSGRAYPLSQIDLLKDGQIIASTFAGPDAKFTISVIGINAGSHSFSIIGKDFQGLASLPQTFPITVSSGVTVTISGLYLAPTLAVDKSEVKRGDNIAIFGQTTPESEVTIGIASEHETFHIISSDDSGVFLYNFNTAPLEKGDHETRAKAAVESEISAFGHTIAFAVGERNVINTDQQCPARGDLNDDCRVNLVDFSIAAFWYKQPLSAGFLLTELERLNGDGQVTLVDFSIMAFYWTG